MNNYFDDFLFYDNFSRELIAKTARELATKKKVKKAIQTKRKKAIATTDKSTKKIKT